MANSAFWRDLAVQFSALRDKRRLRAGGANDSMFISALETLATRGASEIAVAGATDLLHIWLEELRKEGLSFQSPGQSNEVLSEAEYSESIYKGFADGMCEASVTFCNRREAQAVQAEFEDKQRRDVLARQYDIKPEKFTGQLIRMEKLTFRKLRRGETIAEKPFTDSALLNSYESFSKTLGEMRAFIKAKARDVPAVHKQLKDNFARTDLGRAATDENWVTWVSDFLKENATARNVALVFLEEKTGLKRATLKVRFSAARKKRKMRN